MSNSSTSPRGRISKRLVKTEKITRLSVETTPEGEDAISALLERFFGEPPSIYSNVESGISTVTVYGRTAAPAWRARLPALAHELEAVRNCGLDLGPAAVSIRAVPREDWSENWKKFFKTIQVGSALMVKPSWSLQKPKPGQAVVVLDPGLSFGTGQHATTSFCLKELVRLHRKSKSPLSMFDAGCGSGILAIAAAKLGYRGIAAFDFDPIAVRVARENIRSNRVAPRIALSRRDLTRLPRSSRQRYDVLCANLISNLLIDHREILLSRVAPGGTLVLAGILQKEYHLVRAAYEAAGLRQTRTAIEREWQSGSFVGVEIAAD